MTDELVDLQVRSIAGAYRLDTRLVWAIIKVESGGNTWATRYEPKWQWFNDPVTWAAKVGVTVETEHQHQATSWGAMQIMGATARDAGFSQTLPLLLKPVHGIGVACRHLRKLVDKYQERTDYIAAYNGGSPRRGADGQYINQGYVDSVVKLIDGGARGCV